MAPPPTGFGGGGLASVSVSSYFTGNGTSGSPLGISGWPVTFFYSYTNTAASTGPAANQIYLTGFYLSYALTFAHLLVNIAAADNVNNTDFGVYSKAGTLIANIGAAHYASTGLQQLATTQGSQTITAGLYAFAFTSVGTTLKVGQDSGPGMVWALNSNAGTSSGGVLPSSITAITENPTSFPLQMGLF
jgi:hypothetical protein